MQHGADGRALWLPDSPASCSERGLPFDEDTAPYCQVMNIWTLQQESSEGSVPDEAAAVQVSVSSYLLDATVLQHISYGSKIDTCLDDYHLQNLVIDACLLYHMRPETAPVLRSSGIGVLCINVECPRFDELTG